MIQAYLDESGIHGGAGVCAIAGYFGGPGQWRKLGHEWGEIIKQHNVPEFHAKEFWARTPSGERVGPYKGWSDAKAESFLNQLVSTVENRPKIHPVGGVVVMQCFNKLSHNQRRFLTGGKLVHGKFKTSGCPNKSYFLPFQFCAMYTAENAPIGGKAHYFFDLNKQFKGYALDCFALLKSYDLKVKDRLGDIDFKTGLEAVQLQTADLYCYQFYQYSLRKVDNPLEKPNELLRRLVKARLPDGDKLFDDDGLAMLLQGMNIPPDESV